MESNRGKNRNRSFLHKNWLSLGGAFVILMLLVMTVTVMQQQRYIRQLTGALAANPTTSPMPNRPPLGYHDGVDNASCRALGWAFDPDSSSTSIKVHFYRDGPYGGGGTFIAGSTANTSRPDINTAYGIAGNHGFDITFNSSSGLMTGTTHVLYVYAIDTSGNGANPLLTNTPKKIVCPVPSATPTPIPSNPPICLGSSCPPPTATLNQSLPTTTSDGVTPQMFTISWSSTNATSCTVSKQSPDGYITSPWAPSSTAGFKAAGPVLIGTHHWWIDCIGSGGSAHKDIYHQVVTVSPTPIPSNPPICLGSSCPPSPTAVPAAMR